MYNPWKVATIGLAVIGTTALGTGLTTAYFMRPDDAQLAVAAETQAPRALPAASTRVVYRTTAPVTAPAAPVVVPARATAPATVATAPRTIPVSVPDDCATGTDRALRIAKPGALGAILGAGLGAAGGAIADGGKGAGKGALIGGLAGVAAGGGYGAYKTKNECGTIFGSTRLTDAAPTAIPDVAAPDAAAPQSALRESAGDAITVYRAR